MKNKDPEVKAPGSLGLFGCPQESEALFQYILAAAELGQDLLLAPGLEVKVDGEQVVLVDIEFVPRES